MKKMQSNAIQAAKQFQKEIEEDTINIWVKGKRTWGKKQKCLKNNKKSQGNNI